MHLDAWYKSMRFSIMITISINTRGLGVYLTKSTCTKYIFLYHIYYIIAYIHIFA